MKTAEARGGDFRDAAVEASGALLARLAAENGGSWGDPVESGLSYCLRVEGDGAAGLRRLKWITIIALVVGFAGLLCGALLAGAFEHDHHREASSLRLSLAACCSGLGIVGLFYGATAQRRVVQRLARERIAVERPGASRPIHVSIEDSATDQKLKPVSEDVAVLILHPDSGCAQIEGISHRYLVYGHDVVDMQCFTTPYTESVRIGYMIGEVPLSITLVPNSLVSALKRQTIGGKSRLYQDLCSTLQVLPR